MKTGTKSLIWHYYKSTDTHTQHNWVKPNSSMIVWLANSQRAKLFVEYPAKERKNGERRKRYTGQNGRRGGREETLNEERTTQRETARTNGSVGRTARDEAGKWHRRGGNVEPVARDGTGSRDSTGGRR